MRKYLVCLLTALAATLGQAADTPVFHKYVFDDNAIVVGMSDNGKWALMHAGMAEAAEGTLARLVEVDTDKVTELQSADEIEQYGVCTVSDVTDDGNTVVGSIVNRPAYWTKSTKKWTYLPFPDECDGGRIYAVTADGKYAVGSGIYKMDPYKEKGIMWDLTTGKIIELTNIPTLDMSHNDQGQQRFTAVSSDGRYVLATMSYSYLQPLGVCAYVYDRQNQTYKFIGFNSSDTSKWTPLVSGLNFVDTPIMSPNGKWIAANGVMFKSGNEYSISLKYNVENGTIEAYDSRMEDRDVIPGAIDNDGIVYGCSPATTSPIREWSVRHGNYWYPVRNILSQKYGINFEDKTGYGNTGTPMNVSTDGTKLTVMVSPMGESYLLTLPEPAANICATINLLDNYVVTPASGSSFSKLKSAKILFDREIAVTDETLQIELTDEQGSVVATSTSIKVSKNDNREIDIAFLRAAVLEEGKTYTMTVPAGCISIDGDATKTNEAITITYKGRADKPVAATNIYPTNNSELAKIDNDSNPVIITFDAEVAAAEDAQAKLVRNTDGKEMCNLLLLTSGNRVAVFPATVQYLFKGHTYKVVIEPGAVTDLSGNGGNEQITIDYTGVYERTISSDDATLFSDNFDNPAQSLNNFMRYEGDHKTPVATMEAWGFDADNNPWNFTIRDNETSPDYAAASHSMYNPAGQSDDWMVIPQINIPDEYCVLSFDAQSYKANKKDVLKVLIWENDDVINELTPAIVAKMKEEATVVFEEQLTPGTNEETLAGDWKTYNIDLAQYNGKNIYIAFLNDNNDQSVVFMNDVVVKHNMKYLMSLSNEASVVGKESIDIAGKITVNSDTDTYSSITLTLLDAAGNEIATDSKSGLSMKKGDSYEFTFNKPLPLTIGEITEFSIKVRLDNYEDAVKSSVKSLAFEPTKCVVLEEMTGTTCPNCPLGILAIENLEKSFGKQIIPISIHTYTGDPFGAGLNGYSNFLGLSSAPTGVVNRSGEITSPMMSVKGDYMFSNGTDLWFDKVNEELQIPADANIKAEVVLNEEAKTFSMPVTVSYALNAKSLSLNLFYAVMEDGIRSVQANNLGAVSDPDLGEWGQGGKYSSTTVAGYTHNDVVRATLSSYKGIGGYLPQSMEAGKEYTATISDIKLPENIKNLKKAKVVIMLIDANTDKVVNSTCALFPGYTGVTDATTSADCRIVSIGDEINVSASGEINAGVYTMQGTLLDMAQGSDNITLSTAGYRGIAIVRVVSEAGTTTQKIVIR